MVSNEWKLLWKRASNEGQELAFCFYRGNYKSPVETELVEYHKVNRHIPEGEALEKLLKGVN